MNVENPSMSDRIISLTPIAGKPMTNQGLIDKRLFTGENKLHALLAEDGCLWYLKYDNGLLPEPLKQRFTGFNKLMTFVTEYFARRNILAKEIKEVA